MLVVRSMGHWRGWMCAYIVRHIRACGKVQREMRDGTCDFYILFSNFANVLLIEHRLCIDTHAHRAQLTNTIIYLIRIFRFYQIENALAPPLLPLLIQDSTGWCDSTVQCTHTMHKMNFVCGRRTWAIGITCTLCYTMMSCLRVILTHWMRGIFFSSFWLFICFWWQKKPKSLNFRLKQKLCTSNRSNSAALKMVCKHASRYLSIVERIY